MKIAVNIGRLLLAATFIFSGFVKGIDPLGTQYKITDYLEALHIDWMFPSWSTLVMSVLLAMCEFAIGIFLLFAIRRRLVSKLTLLVMAVMTLITLWIVIADPVKDCGCFGDAIVLSNMETFVKNIILLAIAILIWRRPMDMPLLVSRSTRWIVINYTFLFSIVMSTWSLWYLPQFDFRPYHIGANIAKGMEIPKGAKQPKFDTTFILEKNGERKEFTIDNYPDSTWTFIDSKTVQTEEGYAPPIHDFSIEDAKTGEDITQQVIHRKGYTFLLVSPHLEFADDSNFGSIDEIYEYANDHGYPFLCLTASTEKANQALARHHGSRISLLYHRRDNAEDRDTQQPGTPAAERRNHHPEMEPQRPAWHGRDSRQATGTDRDRQDAGSKCRQEDSRHHLLVCHPAGTPYHRRPALGMGAPGSERKRIQTEYYQLLKRKEK